jgi:hypothetical protein
MTKFIYFTILLKFVLKNYKIDYITEICNDDLDYFLHWKKEIPKESDCDVKRNLYVPTIFKNYIKESIYRTKPKYIIFPVVLHDISSVTYTEYKSDFTFKHLVVFLYNTEKKIIEFFDPTNNDKYYDTYLLPETFINYINKNFKNLEIKKSIIINKYNQKNLGLQSIQENELNENEKKLGETIGLCAIYVIWFIEQRIIFDLDDGNTMIRKKINEEKNITNMILKYKNYLDEIYIFNKNLMYNNKKFYEEKYVDICMILDLINSLDEDSSIINDTIW